MSLLNFFKPYVSGDYYVHVSKKTIRPLSGLGALQGFIVLGLFLTNQISAIALLILMLALTLYPFGLLHILRKREHEK
jgi:hypothetical protein